MLKGVNWLSVAAAVVLLEVLGFLWYGPLLGDRWMAAMEGRPPGGDMVVTISLGAVNTVIIVLGLNWLLRRLGVTSTTAAVGAAFAAWFFFNFTTMAVDFLYLGHSAELVAINMGYQLVSYLTVGLVMGLADHRHVGLGARNAS